MPEPVITIERTKRSRWAGIRNRFRYRGKTLKWLLRRAFAGILPVDITRRGGVGVPLPVWFRAHWRPLFEGRVLAADAQLFRQLRREPIEGLWKEHQTATADHGHALWALLTLETWLRGRGDSAGPR